MTIEDALALSGCCRMIAVLKGVLMMLHVHFRHDMVDKVLMEWILTKNSLDN